MYRKRSSIISIKFLSQVSTHLNPFFAFQRLPFSISTLRSESPSDLGHIESDRPDLRNNNGRTAPLGRFNDFQNVSGNPNRFNEKRSDILTTLTPIKSNEGNYLNGNSEPKESFDFSKKDDLRYSKNSHAVLEGYGGTKIFSKSSTEGSTISGQHTSLNNIQNLRGGSNEILNETHNKAYDLRNSINKQTHQCNSQSTYYAEDGHRTGNQNVGNGVYQERYNFSPNLQHTVLNQQQPNVFDAKSSTDLKQNANGCQRLNYASDFDNRNRFSENFQSNGTRVGSELSPMNNVHNVSDNQRTVSSQYAYVNGTYHHNQYGPYSTNLQQNSNGYIHQFNANEIRWENLNCHNNNLNNTVSRNGDQLNHWNYGQNTGANQTSACMGNSVSTHSNSNGYQRNNLGEAHQWKHGGFSKEYQNGHMNNTHVVGSTLAAQYNHLNNYQTSYNGYPENNIGQVQQNKYSSNHQQYNFSGSENLNSDSGYHNHYMNSVGELKRDDSGDFSKRIAVADSYPYGRANGMFRSSNIMLNQEPSKSFMLCSEQIGQGLSDNGSSETVKIISFEDCMYKLDAFCAEGKVKEAVAILAVLEKISICIDVSSYLKLMKVCGNAKSLDNAKIVHAHLSRSLDYVAVSVHNEIIDMYSKCGSMADANKLFLKPIEKNSTTWENMIKGLASNGRGEEAIDLFKEFKKTSLKPDGSLFNALFYTCGILSAVDQGLLYLKSMRVDYSISPTMENYASIVDMLGRSGHLDEAVDFIESLPIEESNVDLWFTLMSYCRINGYIELGNRCAEVVDQLDPSKLSDESRKGLLPLRSLELLKENELETSNDYDNQKHQTHEYMAGRTNDHVMNEHIRCLAHQLKEAGYVPDIACTLHDVDPENREEALMFHSERLAMVHAFMITPPRREIRIIKNLRACRDCHNVMKIVSSLTGRTIVARDSKRFHHFRDGKCSCNDFW